LSCKRLVERRYKAPPEIGSTKAKMLIGMATGFRLIIAYTTQVKIALLMKRLYLLLKTVSAKSLSKKYNVIGGRNTRITWKPNNNNVTHSMFLPKATTRPLAFVEAV
jgi:hypothetical protein